MILSTASSLTSEDRAQTYGDCLTNMAAYAELKQWYEKYRACFGLAALSNEHEAAMMMVLAKIARIAVGQFHADNYIDAAAYLGIAFECEERKGYSPARQ